MVAWIIKLSGLLFEGELGVRFITCLLSIGFFFILWAIIEHPKKKDYVPHFFVVAFSMTLLNAYGFFTLPDTPLLFFTALFLLIYKKFIASPNVFLSITLGVVMAALMYSNCFSFQSKITQKQICLVGGNSSTYLLFATLLMALRT